MTTDQFTHAQQVENAIDLRRQMRTLEQDDSVQPDIVFRDTSPPTRWDYVYSMESGERIQVKRHRLEATLMKRLPSGFPAFTADPDRAPTYIQGTTRCFLAKDSPQRSEVDRLNISPGFYCIAVQLANEGAMEEHAAHKHPTRWARFTAALEREERQADRLAQRNQMEAMMVLAGGKTPVAVAEKPAVDKVPCEVCGQPLTPGIGTRSHMRSKHGGGE